MQMRGSTANQFSAVEAEVRRDDAPLSVFEIAIFRLWEMISDIDKG